MLKNRVFHDIAVGGGLGAALLMIFLIDRLVSSSASQRNSAGTRTVRQGGTLLGDDEISVRLKALGSQERLEKLQVVRLNAKASFAEARNVNDITLMWCWEPKITMRFVEKNPFVMRRFRDLVDLNQRTAENVLLENFKEKYELRGEHADQFEREARQLFARRDYEPFFASVLLLDNKDAFEVFNERLSFPLKSLHATQMRNLCFALSVSNLVPIRRHNFGIDPGLPTMVKGRMCDQFTVHDPEGLKLQLFFDQETKLLAKIAHMGHRPRGVPGTDKEVFWEHYFSDYRETEGIKQWRKAEVDTDGRRFATLDVSSVEFFDEMRSELQRPGQ